MRIGPAPLTLVFLLLFGAVAGAGQDQDKGMLDGLFARLQSTADASEAAGIERRIWRIWMHSEKEDLNVLMHQGAAAMARKDFKLALESFNALIRLAPGMAEAWNKRATLYYMMRNFDASIADVKQTLALEPRHFGAIVGLGLIYEQLGDPQAALRAYREGLKINPHMARILEKSKKIARELKDQNI